MGGSSRERGGEVEEMQAKTRGDTTDTIPVGGLYTHAPRPTMVDGHPHTPALRCDADQFTQSAHARANPVPIALLKAAPVVGKPGDRTLLRWSGIMSPAAEWRCAAGGGSSPRPGRATAGGVRWARPWRAADLQPTRGCCARLSGHPRPRRRNWRRHVRAPKQVAFPTCRHSDSLRRSHHYRPGDHRDTHNDDTKHPTHQARNIDI